VCVCVCLYGITQICYESEFWNFGISNFAPFHLFSTYIRIHAPSESILISISLLPTHTYIYIYPIYYQRTSSLSLSLSLVISCACVRIKIYVVVVVIGKYILISLSLFTTYIYDDIHIYHTCTYMYTYIQRSSSLPLSRFTAHAFVPRFTLSANPF
jgi:hypothetical protein